MHPQIAAAYDAAQQRAAVQIIGWLAEHATTRVGPRGRQVQVPVEQLEAIVVRHYTSRAGDPHRHLHLQVNARVLAGRWRGLHSVGVVDGIAAVNGIGHAAVMCDPQFRGVLAAHGYTLEPETGEVAQLAPYVGSFSARAAQISRTIDSYEGHWRSAHPVRSRARPCGGLGTVGRVPRPDRTRSSLGTGTSCGNGGLTSCRSTGSRPRPSGWTTHPGVQIGRVNREAVVNLVLSRLGARRSSWNAADIRGEVEQITAAVGVVAPAPVRSELVEDLTARTVTRCVPLLPRGDVPGHVRALTSRQVLEVEADLVSRIAARAEQPATGCRIGNVVARRQLDHAQRQVVAALGGTAQGSARSCGRFGRQGTAIG